MDTCLQPIHTAQLAETCSISEALVKGALASIKPIAPKSTPVFRLILNLS